MARKENQSMNEFQNAIDLFAAVIAPAIPYAVVFALGQRIVTMFLGMAFKGSVEI